jgi:hypothetical protein
MMYKIVRFYQRDKPSRVVKRGLTLDEAKEHCRDPETSSSTCTTPSRKAITRKNGPWFDGFTEE